MYNLSFLSADNYSADMLQRLGAVVDRYNKLYRRADQFIRLNPHVWSLQGDCGVSLGWSIKSLFKRAAKAIKGAAKKVGKAIKKGAKSAYSLAKKAAKSIAKSVPGGDIAAEYAIDAAEKAVRKAAGALRKGKAASKTIDRSKFESAQISPAEFATPDLAVSPTIKVKNTLDLPAQQAMAPAAAAGGLGLLIPIAIAAIAFLTQKKGR